MSQNVLTKNGWVQTSGNVNPQLIDDVNQRIDGYVEKGYLSDNLANVTSGAIDANGDRVIRVSDGTKTDRIGYTYKENTQYTLSARIKLSDASSQIRFGVEYTDGTTAYTFLSNYSTEYADKVATTVEGKTVKSIFLWNASSGDLYIYKDRIQLIEGTSTIPYVPSNVELQSEIDALLPVVHTNVNFQTCTASEFNQFMLSNLPKDNDSIIIVSENNHFIGKAHRMNANYYFLRGFNIYGVVLSMRCYNGTVGRNTSTVSYTNVD